MQMIKVRAYSKDGNIEFTNVELPAKRIVCPTCDGTGKHVNRAIDGDGLTAEDFENDPEFEESYFSGRYDVTCEHCKGLNVIDVIDEDACKARLSWWKGLIRHMNALQLESDSRMESYYERLAGA